MNICPIAKTFTKVDSKFCQMLTTLQFFKNLSKWHFLPNLVSLDLPIQICKYSMKGNGHSMRLHFCKFYYKFIKCHKSWTYLLAIGIVLHWNPTLSLVSVVPGPLMLGDPNLSQLNAGLHNIAF